LTALPDVAARQAFRENLAVLSCLLAGRVEEARERLAAGGPGGGDFLRFIERHLLAWYLAPLLDTAGLRAVFDPDDLARVERGVATRRARQGILVDELARLWPCFRERRLDVLLLKGPHLAARFFGGAHERGFVDLDLLIRPEQLLATERLLAESGYELLSKVLIARGLTTRFTHGFDFAKDDLRVDLHWSLGSHVSYRIDYDRIWRSSAPFRIGRDEVSVLSDEDALFFHLLSLFEDLDRGAARLRSFVDVYAMLVELDDRIDWPAFWERRRSERTAGVCGAALALFFALFDLAGRFPRAAGAIARAADADRSRSWDELTALIEARPGALRNKAWAIRAYECPIWMSLAWWSVSLPFRLAVYHPGPNRAEQRRTWRPRL
jgi:hypothetical protein